MAMTKCNECAGDISSTARACPHCGAAVTGNTEVSNNTLAILLGFLALGSLISFICFLSCIQSCVEGFTEVVKGVDPGLQQYKPRGQTDELTGEESDIVVELPLTDNVLGAEYELKKIDGGWEVYKNDGSVVYQAMERDRCLKYVKELRGL